MAIILLAVPVVIVDQLSKLIITRNLQPGDSLPIIKNIFHLSLVYNKGLAFGIFSQASRPLFLFILYAVVIILAIFACSYVFYKKFLCRGGSGQISLSLILGGALGNLIDRIRLGCVIDFLDLRIWPVFNIADSAITIGAILLVLQILRRRPKNLMTNIKTQNPNKIQISNH